MNIILPAIPAGMIVLVGFFAPYAVAALNGLLPFVKQPWQKKVVTVTVAAALAVLVVVFYYAITGDVVPAWPLFVILALLVVSTSYALVTRKTAAKVEESIDGRNG